MQPTDESLSLSLAKSSYQVGEQSSDLQWHWYTTHNRRDDFANLMNDCTLRKIIKAESSDETLAGKAEHSICTKIQTLGMSAARQRLAEIDRSSKWWKDGRHTHDGLRATPKKQTLQKMHALTLVPGGWCVCGRGLRDACCERERIVEESWNPVKRSTAPDYCCRLRIRKGHPERIYSEEMQSNAPFYSRNLSRRLVSSACCHQKSVLLARAQ